MDSRLLESFRKKTEKELLFYFRTDGSINFEKKIAAGIVLKERGYYKVELSKEKKQIVDSIKKQIKKDGDSNNLRSKFNRNINQKIFYGLVFLLISVGFELKGYWIDNEGLSWWNLVKLLVLGLAFITYQLINKEKKIEKRIAEYKENNKLLNQRLQIIEKEWAF